MRSEIRLADRDILLKTRLVGNPFRVQMLSPVTSVPLPS